MYGADYGPVARAYARLTEDAAVAWLGRERWTVLEAVTLMNNADPEKLPVYPYHCKVDIAQAVIGEPFERVFEQLTRAMICTVVSDTVRIADLAGRRVRWSDGDLDGGSDGFMLPSFWDLSFPPSAFFEFACGRLFPNEVGGYDVRVFGLCHDEPRECEAAGRVNCRLPVSDELARALGGAGCDYAGVMERAGYAVPEPTPDAKAAVDGMAVRDVGAFEVVPGVSVSDLRAMLAKGSPEYCPRLLAAIRAKVALIPLQREVDLYGFSGLNTPAKYRTAAGKEATAALTAMGLFDVTVPKGAPKRVSKADRDAILRMLTPPKNGAPKAN